MATVADLTSALAAATHAPPSDVRQRVRALREAGELPTSRHSLSAPHVTQSQAALALIAVLAGGALAATVERAREYAALRIDDASLHEVLTVELDRIGAAASEFDELVLVEEPVASARIWYSTADDGDVSIRFGPHPGPRWTERHFRRDGLEILARALDS